MSTSGFTLANVANVLKIIVSNNVNNNTINSFKTRHAFAHHNLNLHLKALSIEKDSSLGKLIRDSAQALGNAHYGCLKELKRSEKLDNKLSKHILAAVKLADEKKVQDLRVATIKKLFQVAWTITLKIIANSEFPAEDSGTDFLTCSALQASLALLALKFFFEQNEFKDWILFFWHVPNSEKESFDILFNFEAIYKNLTYAENQRSKYDFETLEEDLDNHSKISQEIYSSVFFILKDILPAMLWKFAQDHFKYDTHIASESKIQAQNEKTKSKNKNNNEKNKNKNKNKNKITNNQKRKEDWIQNQNPKKRKRENNTTNNKA